MSSSRLNLGSGLSLVRKVPTEAEWTRPVSQQLEQVADNFAALYQQDALDAMRAVLEKLNTDELWSKTSLPDAVRSLEEEPRGYLGLICESEKTDARMPSKLSLFMRQLFMVIRALEEEERSAHQRQENTLQSVKEGASSSSNPAQQ